MLSYYERYIHGEYKQVWDDLASLGESVRSETVYYDALAVAQETMRRVRINIELLVERLPQVGYLFGYSKVKSQIPPNVLEDLFKQDAEFWNSLDPDTTGDIQKSMLQEAREDPQVWISQKPQVWVPASAKALSQISQLEAMVGTLPLSLQVWYSEIQEVNFYGSIPDTWIQSVRQDPQKQVHGFDPLYIISIQQILEQQRYFIDKHHWNVQLAAHEICKGDPEDQGGYRVLLPNACVDAPFLDEWHTTSFVNYLRICFRWGGLPGMEFFVIPREEFRYITEALLPI